MKKIFLSLALIFSMSMISWNSIDVKELEAPTSEDVACTMTQTTTVTTNSQGTTTTIVETNITCDTMAELAEFLRLRDMK